MDNLAYAAHTYFRFGLKGLLVVGSLLNLSPDMRFDDRVLRLHDDGKDFEDFTLEAFPHVVPGLNPYRRLATGRDGAIDLLHEDASGATAVVECKFLGKDVSDKPSDRWREVEKHLRDHLPDLAADSSKEPQSPYRRWLLSAKPVTAYYFCVTHPMPHVAVDALEKLIQKTFTDLSASAGLEHLRSLGSTPGAVRVLPWDRLHQAAGAVPALRFRWFGGLPPGVEPLLGDAAFVPGKPSFRDFLCGGVLPFFSRSQYIADTAARALPTEDALIRDLTDDGGSSALVLSGPGGVGKTRLALELGRRLRSGDWLVVMLRQTAGGEAVEALLRSHARQARLLLILDYAEAALHLSEVAEAVRRGRDEGGHQVRLIVTCRGSAQVAVEDALSDLEPQILHLDAAGGADAARYIAWVAERILAEGDIPDPAATLLACDHLPALATFAVYLRRIFPERFDNQFGALHDIRDFKGWVERRAGRLLGGQGKDEAALAALGDLALSLPIPATVRDAIHQCGGPASDLLARLEDDRWVERDGDFWFAAHDVLADGLADYALLRQAASATRRLGEALCRAAAQGRLGTALVATDRLARLSHWTAIQGLEVVRAVRFRHGDVLLAELHRLLRGSLLDLPGKVALAEDWPALRTAVETERVGDLPLAALAEQAAKMPPETGFRARFLAVFGTALDTAVATGHPSNMVVRRAYVCAPDRYRAAALARIEQEPTAPQTHFLLAAMLKAGEPPVSLRPAVVRWLTPQNQRYDKASFVYEAWLAADGDIGAVAAPVQSWLRLHAEAREASHVYQPWLDADGDIEAVAAPVQSWLRLHGETSTASHVYKAWLTAGGDIAVVAAPVPAWLRAHGEIQGASHVYKAWLGADGDIVVVAASVQAWLRVHGETPEASHVYKAWLDADGDVEVIAASVQAWLRVHAEAPEASYVYKQWLGAGGDIEVIAAPAQAWLRVHSETPQARFVCNAWLDAGGDVADVAASVQAWLRAHGETSDARFVYKAWLDADGGIEAVAASVQAWLHVHGDTHDACFVYAAWLEARGDFEIVRDGILAWVHAYADQEDAGYLMKSLSMRRDLPDQALEDIARWAACFSSHEDAIFRISRISPALASKSLGAAARQAILRSGHAVLGRLFENAPPPVLAMDAARAVAILLQNLCRGMPDIAELQNATQRSLALVVASAAVFRPGSNLFITANVILNLAAALAAKELDSHRDRIGLKAFIDCFIAQDRMTDNDVNALNILARDHPDPLWDDAVAAVRRRLS